MTMPQSKPDDHCLQINELVTGRAMRPLLAGQSYEVLLFFSFFGCEEYDWKAIRCRSSNNPRGRRGAFATFEVRFASVSALSCKTHELRLQ